MTVPDQSTPQSDHASSAGRRPRRRRWSTYLLIALVALVVVAGGGYVALVEYRGYCGSDFLPLEDDVAAEPYVQNVTSNAATIMWRTEASVDGTVTFGADGDLDQLAEGESTELHTVRLTGLEPGTEYAYRVQSGDTTFETSTFSTAPGPDGAITAIVVGDTGSGDEQQQQMSEVMEGMNGDLLLHTGDVVYQRGAACHYEERYYDPYAALIDSVPVYPVLGNHDVLTDNGEPYLTAFELPAESSGTERFYSFDYGPMHVAALDSELYYGDDSISTEEQKAWLRADLQATDRPWKVVVIHRPPYSSSPYHGGDRNILEDLVGIFEEEGVDVVFAGHEHVYERLKPINDITYFVSGGGGGDLRGAGTTELTAVSALRYHALEVEATPDRMVIEAVGIDGDVFDRIELTQPAGDSGREMTTPMVYLTD